jgi:hypothetical protein
VKTGKTQPEPVTAVLVRHDTDRYDLTVKTSHGTAIIDTTGSHLFWNQTTRQWVKAAALRHGTYLRTPSGASVTVLSGTVPADTSGWMWDLSVPGGNDHDFYIDLVHAAVLVHNCDDPFEGTRYSSKVQQQMSGPAGEYHSCPEIVQNYATPDDVSVEPGADGEPYTHVRIPGGRRAPLRQ